MSKTLNKLIQLEKEASLYGFNWPNQHAIIKQAIDECMEIEQAINSNESESRIQEEIGDLIHASISLCIFSGFDVEKTLVKLVNKFEHRMSAIKSIAKKMVLIPCKVNQQSLCLSYGMRQRN